MVRFRRKSAAELPMRRFRMTQLELFSLQSCAGAGHGGEPALLALPDGAPRQVSQGPRRTHGEGAARIDREPASQVEPKRVASRGAKVPSRTQPVIWIHAVSLGEVLAVSGLVEQMRRAFPHHRVLVSTTTDTGQALARKRFGDADVFYFPMDFAFAIRPYLQALQPELVVLAETEFWPNFLRLAHASGARIAVVNARISDRSLAELSTLSLGPAKNADARRSLSGADRNR